jgi:MazG family protein
MDRIDEAAAKFGELCRTMAKLRRECPWDRAQTSQSLRPFLLEEAYEVVAAIEGGDAAARREELGDLLLQVVFQTEIASQAGEFEMHEVVAAINAKLVQRHPHVFGSQPGAAGTADFSPQTWEQIKANNRPAKSSRLSGVASGMPALLRAHRVGHKAAAARFDWPDAASVAAKVREEWDELCAEMPGPGEKTIAAAQRDRIEEEFGDLLFALANLARHLGVEPEGALHRAIRKFEARFMEVERLCRDRKIQLDNLSLAELDALWEEAKVSLSTQPS